MSITDKLREWSERYTMRKDLYDELTTIADRIDAEHDKALNSMDDAYDSGHNVGYDKGFASAVDWITQHEEELEKHGWVRLPVDADGEYIHIGDELRDEWHEQNQGEVERLMLNYYGWWFMLKSCPERFYVHEFHEWHHRHHKPTVEDVLDEFASAYDRIGGEDEEHQKYLNLIAEYAAKLRLADDGKEQ